MDTKIIIYGWSISSNGNNPISTTDYASSLSVTAFLDIWCSRSEYT